MPLAAPVMTTDLSRKLLGEKVWAELTRLAEPKRPACLSTEALLYVDMMIQILHVLANSLLQWQLFV